MTTDQLEKAFDKWSDEYIKFEKIEHKLSNRPDLHAFILLDKLVPGKSDIVAAAEHDSIYLDIKPEDLAEVIKDEQVKELTMCGVFWGEDGLEMFT